MYLPLRALSALGDVEEDEECVAGLSGCCSAMEPCGFHIGFENEGGMSLCSCEESMSNKRSNSFRRAILQGSRQRKSAALLEEPGLGVSQRLVRHVAFETLPREIDRKWYYDSYTGCPPPWFIIVVTIVEATESQKKKQNNADDSDDFDDDEEAGPSFQQQTAQPQQSYMPPMTQPGMLPVPGAPGMPPNNYSGMPPMMPGVPHMMPGMPPVMPGMPPGMMPMGGMMPPGPGMPPMMHGMHHGMPPPVGPRPGMPLMGQGPPVTAQGLLSRPAQPVATAPNPQPPVTKPLFPSAGQMGTHVPSTSSASSSADTVSASSKPLFPSTAQAQQAVSGPVGTDFKPLNTPATSAEPPKPTFPAYTQSTALTTNATNSTVSKPPATVTSKPATLTTTSATSKLIHPDEDISLEERRAQLPKYQRNLPRQGQPPMGAPPVGPMGGMMHPQQGMPPQQPGMRHPMPPHGQYGGPPQGMPGYMSGGMPPYGQGHPMVPPFQGGPPRPPMRMRPPVMSQGGRY
ncbi:UNVERIFIED_CONTAM: hypothetical protein FKN15_014689 [Acipenser sinensis]